MSASFLLLLLVVILVVSIVPEVVIYFLLRNRVSRDTLIALLIGVPLTIAVVVILIAAAMVITMSDVGGVRLDEEQSIQEPA